MRSGSVHFLRGPWVDPELTTEYTNFVASGPLNNDWKYETKSLLFGENTQAHQVISQECHFTFEAR